jgi:hypothetical protein
VGFYLGHFLGHFQALHSVTHLQINCAVHICLYVSQEHLVLYLQCHENVFLCQSLRKNFSVRMISMSLSVSVHRR